jgi:hypothetical protein
VLHRVASRLALSSLPPPAHHPLFFSAVEFPPSPNARGGGQLQRCWLETESSIETMQQQYMRKHNVRHIILYIYIYIYAAIL